MCHECACTEVYDVSFTCMHRGVWYVMSVHAQTTPAVQTLLGDGPSHQQHLQ